MNASRSIYLDTSAAQRLLDNPKEWDSLKYSFINKYGGTFNPHCSYYLFFKQCFNLTSDKHRLKFDSLYSKGDKPNNNHDAAHKLEAAFDSFVDVIKSMVANDFQKRALGHLFYDKIEKEFYADTSNQMKKMFVASILNDFHYNYDYFIEMMAYHWAWYEFCNFMPADVPRSLVRQVQLTVWLRLRYQGMHLPLSIIDNYPKLYSKPIQDWNEIIDAQAITYLLLGLQEDEIVKPIYLITRENLRAIEQRIATVLYALNDLKRVEPIPFCLGTICQINDNMKIEQIYEPQDLNLNLNNLHKNTRNEGCHFSNFNG